jgi:hypothetical protein
MPANGRVTLAATLKFPTRHFVASRERKVGYLLSDPRSKSTSFGRSSPKRFYLQTVHRDAPGSLLFTRSGVACASDPSNTWEECEYHHDLESFVRILLYLLASFRPSPTEVRGAKESITPGGRT